LKGMWIRSSWTT